MLLVAKYRGRCMYCKEYFEIGETIELVMDNMGHKLGYAHTDVDVGVSGCRFEFLEEDPDIFHD